MLHFFPERCVRESAHTIARAKRNSTEPSNRLRKKRKVLEVGGASKDEDSKRPGYDEEIPEGDDDGAFDFSDCHDDALDERSLKIMQRIKKECTGGTWADPDKYEKWIPAKNASHHPEITCDFDYNCTNLVEEAFDIVVARILGRPDSGLKLVIHRGGAYGQASESAKEAAAFIVYKPSRITPVTGGEGGECAGSGRRGGVNALWGVRSVPISTQSFDMKAITDDMNKIYDTTRDIGVTKDEVEEIRDLFTLYDKDGDGYLGEEDMKYVMETMYMFEPTSAEVRSAIKLMVPHHEGYRVDFKSFLWYKIHDRNMRRKHAASKDMREAFNFLDRDKDGHLGYEDLVHLFGLIDVQRTQAQIEETMAEADYDGDGKINFDDFCKTMTTFVPNQLRKYGLKGLRSHSHIIE
eukprot:g2795.t1